MRIEFEYIIFKNILRFGDYETKISFKNGIDIIVGKNGLGKTTFIDALCFNLYGKPFRKMKIPNLINNKNMKNLYTESCFKIGKNKFKVIRALKPHRFEILKYENGNWKLIDQLSSNKEYQKYFEENILGVNENVFRQLIALGANITNARQFMDLSAKEKEEILQVMTNTAIFSVLDSIIKEKKNSFKTLVKEHEYRVDVLQKNKESLEKQINQIEEQNKKYIEERDQRLKELENSILSLKEQLQNKKEEYKNKKEESGILQGDINSASKLFESENKLQIALEKYTSLLQYIQSKPEIVCPECGNVFKDTDKDENDVKAQISKINEGLKKAQEALAPIREKEKRLKSLQFEVQELANEMISLKNEIKRLKEEMQRVKEMKEVQIDYSDLNDVIKKYNEEKSALLRYKKELADYEKLAEILSHENLKGKILEQRLPLLNKYINEYLEKYETPYNFIITPDLKEKILTRNLESEYHSLSNGQKQRIVLSILFSFLKIIEIGGISTNLLILDEFLDSSLDDQGTEQTLEILKNEFADKKNVLIISHNFGIKNKLEDISTVYEVSEYMGFTKLSERE